MVRYPSISPGDVNIGLERALRIACWGDELNDCQWGGCGAVLVLLWGFGSSRNFSS